MSDEIPIAATLTDDELLAEFANRKQCIIVAYTEQCRDGGSTSMTTRWQGNWVEAIGLIDYGMERLREKIKSECGRIEKEPDDE